MKRYKNKSVNVRKQLKIKLENTLTRHKNIAGFKPPEQQLYNTTSNGREASKPYDPENNKFTGYVNTSFGYDNVPSMFSHYGTNYNTVNTKDKDFASLPLFVKYWEEYADDDKWDNMTQEEFDYYSPRVDEIIDRHEIRYKEGYFATFDRLVACGRPRRIAYELLEDAFWEHWGLYRYSTWQSFKAAYYRDKKKFGN